MEPSLIFLAIFIASIVSRTSSKKSTIVSVIVCIGILIWGLGVYLDGGTLFFMGIRLNFAMFSALIGLMLFVNIRRLVNHYHKSSHKKQLSDQLNKYMQSGFTVKDAVLYTVSEMSTDMAELRSLAMMVLEEKPRKQILTYAVTQSEGNRGEAVMQYIKALKTIEFLQKQAAKIADDLKMPESMHLINRYPYPGVIIAGRRMFSKFRPGDVIYAIDNEMVDSLNGFRELINQVSEKKNLELSYLRFNQKNKKWSDKTLVISRNRLNVSDFSENTGS